MVEVGGVLLISITASVLVVNPVYEFLFIMVYLDTDWLNLIASKNNFVVCLSTIPSYNYIMIEYRTLSCSFPIDAVR